MHAQLVRAGCTLPALQASLLPQLLSFLGAYSWNDAGQAAWLASLIPDIVDAVQSTEGRSGGFPRLLWVDLESSYDALPRAASPCLALPCLALPCLALP